MSMLPDAFFITWRIEGFLTGVRNKKIAERRGGLVLRRGVSALAKGWLFLSIVSGLAQNIETFMKYFSEPCGKTDTRPETEKEAPFQREERIPLCSREQNAREKPMAAVKRNFPGLPLRKRRGYIMIHRAKNTAVSKLRSRASGRVQVFWQDQQGRFATPREGYDGRMIKILTREGRARRGVFQTPHGEIQTPAFMNVATSGAIKGGVSALDLAQIKCQVMLCNTYHLHLRPGDALIRELGGLHAFTRWQGPILTDSGGFQVFSLSTLRKIQEEGVYFASHIDGQRIFMGPEESMRIQSNLGSTIAMAFDECVENPATYEYAKHSCERTVRWLHRCKAEMEKRRALPGALNPEQLLFGINQGCTFEDLRLENMREIARLNLDGYAIGGLAVGEPAAEMYRVIAAVEPEMPEDKPRYLMGVGTPGNILEAVRLGVDLFDCVMPSRNARHGRIFTWSGALNLLNAKYERDLQPLDPLCDCPVCQNFSRAYLRHLFKSGEMLAMRLSVLHNLYFYNTLAMRIREALEEGRFQAFYDAYFESLDRRI